MKRVLVVQQRLPHYRVAFFEMLRAALNSERIELALGIGTPHALDNEKQDEAWLDWARRLPTRYALHDRVCWLPFDTTGFDLVIVSQENRFLFHPWLLRPWRDYRVGLLGHGANLAAATSSPGEVYKRCLTRRADWWFAYTEASREVFERAGCPSARISVFNNAVDTRALRTHLDTLSQTDAANWREAMSIPQGPIGVFVGSLYAQKRLDFLIEAAETIRMRCPRFSLIIAGDGPDRWIVQQAAAKYHWIRWLGPVHGQAKALLLHAADAMLMPFSVGLSILDAFAAGIPICTTSGIGHGPEICYLSPDINGVQTAPEVLAYAEAAALLLSDQSRMWMLGRAAFETAQGLSVEQMTLRFADGIRTALALPRR